MTETYDVFLSYAHVDAPPVDRLADALRSVGVRVWHDRHEIEDFESITRAVVDGLAHSRAMLCFYSERYLTRRACQWELMAALVASQGSSARRTSILVVNPERDPTDPAGLRMSTDHIRPSTLRDSLVRRFPEPGDQDGLAELAGTVAHHVAGIGKVFGDLGLLTRPDWHPSPRTGSPRFVGRIRELIEINDLLHAEEAAGSSGRRGSGVAVVSGHAGAGKTLLAEEYALRFGAAYPGGVFWLSAAEAEDSGGRHLNQMQMLAGSLGMAVEGLTAEQLAGLLRSAIEQSGRPALWVVDDLPADLPMEDLRAWLSPSRLCCTLVTTRGRSDLGHRLIALDDLEPGDAIALLTARREPTGADEIAAAGDIATALGHHALALDVVGAALALDGARTYRETERDLARTDRDRLAFAADLVEGLPYERNDNIAAVLTQSISELGGEGLDVLMMADLLGPEPIGADLVAEIFAEVDGLTGPDAADLRALGFAQLDRRGLAMQAGISDRRVHALTARTVHFLNPAPERKAAVSAAAISVLLGRLDPDEGVAFLARARDAAHALALVSQEKGVRATALLERIGRFQLTRGAFGLALTLFQDLADRLEVHQPPDEVWRLITAYNLAESLRGLGRFEAARSLGERAADGLRNRLGEEDPRTIEAMLGLAATCLMAGDREVARSLQETALSAQRRRLGEGHILTLRARNNLAMTAFAAGDLAEALRLQTGLPDAVSAELGADHPETLRANGSLAATHHARGELAQARLLQERVLAQARHVLGDDHPDTLMHLSALAQTLLGQSRVAEAQTLLEEARARLVGTLGEDHPVTLELVGTLAMSRLMTGDLAGAEELQRRALDDAHRTLGEDHPATLRAMVHLAGILFTGGQFDRARDLYERALATTRRTLGDRHVYTVTTLTGLGATLAALGDRPAAQRVQTEALAVARKVLGAEHPTTLQAVSTLATARLEYGDPTGARVLLDEALPIACRTLGADHVDTLRMTGVLGIALGALGETGRSRQLIAQAHAGLVPIMGPDHPTTRFLAGTLNAAQ